MKLELCVAVLGLALVSGCGLRVESPSPVSPPVSPQVESSAPAVKSDFGPRLEAAKGIVNSNDRDEACLHLAAAAAGAGDAIVARSAVLLIVNTSTRDQAAYRASLLLAKNNQGEAANEIVKMIVVINLQDQARAKIAKGEYSF